MVFECFMSTIIIYIEFILSWAFFYHLTSVSVDTRIQPIILYYVMVTETDMSILVNFF